MFQEMDEALYEDCRLRFENDEVCAAPSFGFSVLISFADTDNGSETKFSKEIVVPISGKLVADTDLLGFMV